MMQLRQSLLLVVFLMPLQLALAQTVLITGSNQGIGLEFATQYLDNGWNVIATHRRSSTPDSLAQLATSYPELLRIELVDITDIEQVKELGTRLNGVPIDVLVNNAGFAGAMHTDEQSFGSLDYDVFEVVMRTNGLGALAVTEALVGSIKAGTQKKVIAMSSTLASFSQGPPSGGGYWYRMAKAALHMSYINMAKDLREEGVIVTLVSPGIVFSEKNLGRGTPANIMIDGAISVAGMIKVIDGLTLGDSGRFINYKGEELGL
jgi:NAD(P)-dependent dehydrogenase (short-subunit alcohol dehydrogenase family)